MAKTKRMQNEFGISNSEYKKMLAREHNRTYPVREIQEDAEPVTQRVLSKFPFVINDDH